MKIQVYFKAVAMHTMSAIQRWGYMDRGVSKATWNQVLLEEVGKLARCCNKLALAEDRGVREQWEKEAKHRLISIGSVCARYYDCFARLPDADNGNKSDIIHLGKGG